MMVLPLVFITVIAHFPIGLVIYWVTTNLWTVGQGLITRRLVPKTAAATQTAPKRSSRAPAQAPAAVEEQPAGNGTKSQPAKTPPSAPKQRQPSTQPRRVKRNRGHGRR
jgi:YidC/Oxa1 family membrane protein insertase